MFYQSLPLNNSFGFLPMAVMPSTNFLLLQSTPPPNLALAQALEKSVANYSLTFEQPLIPPPSQEAPISSSAPAKRSKTSPQVSPKEEVPSRQIEKNSEF